MSGCSKRKWTKWDSGWPNDMKSETVVPTETCLHHKVLDQAAAFDGSCAVDRLQQYSSTRWAGFCVYNIDEKMHNMLDTVIDIQICTKFCNLCSMNFHYEPCFLRLSLIMVRQGTPIQNNETLMSQCQVVSQPGEKKQGAEHVPLAPEKRCTSGSSPPPPLLPHRSWGTKPEDKINKSTDAASSFHSLPLMNNRGQPPTSSRFLSTLHAHTYGGTTKAHRTGS